jgi:hypothetical protein
MEKKENLLYNTSIFKSSERACIFVQKRSAKNLLSVLAEKFAQARWPWETTFSFSMMARLFQGRRMVNYVVTFNLVIEGIVHSIRML